MKPLLTMGGTDIASLPAIEARALFGEVVYNFWLRVKDKPRRRADKVCTGRT